MKFGIDTLRDFDNSSKKEWLLTNGLGGFAASTIIGTNTRRYHGLLIASFNPPTERELILSKLNEVLIIDGEEFPLSTDVTGDFISGGLKYQQAFIYDLLPTFVYRIKDVTVEKKLALIYGSNSIVIIYKIKSLKSHAKIKIAPLVNMRDYHQLNHKSQLKFEKSYSNGCLKLVDTKSGKEINIQTNIPIYEEVKDCYFENMTYQVEKDRGLDFSEDHYIPIIYDELILPGEENNIWFYITTEDRKCVDGFAEVLKEEERQKKVSLECPFSDDFSQKLFRSALQFITKRATTNAKTIIAGYPWFADWGRDTMISFTGITLCTGRFDDAREILHTFASYEREGLLPNTFPDDGKLPFYNTVDASLWFFEACYKYLKYTNDRDFLDRELLPVLLDIVEFYRKGTLYNIYMDKDFLLSAGDVDTQLTWMDAKADGKPVTPRYGKCVEINALWYNALKIVAELCKDKIQVANEYETMANSVKDSFEKSFAKVNNGLYDVVRVDFIDEAIRPNQIIAASLSFPVIHGELAKTVVDIVWDKLYTPFGLSTLSEDSLGYRGIYTGGPLDRDLSYHQGTTWTWLIGHFITAFIRVYGRSDNTIDTAKELLKPLEDHMNEGCLLNISEIFDGSWPHTPRGCFAQAWSVAEVLRCLCEDVRGNQ